MSESFKDFLAETTMWLQVEPQKYSIYREEAIDAITMALEDSLVDEKVREKCCRALLILGRRFSFSGKSLTESWILKQAGFKDIYEVNLLENEDDNSLADDTVWVSCFHFLLTSASHILASIARDTCMGFPIIFLLNYSLWLKVI
jgi:hypothetical protein